MTVSTEKAVSDFLDGAGDLGVDEVAQLIHAEAVINKSGLEPFEYACLVQLKKVEETSEGGIILTNATQQKEQWAKTEATLIAVGGNAFFDWKGDTPEVGDNVVIRQYSGQQTYTGDDGGEYQFLNDKDIRGRDRRQS